MYTCLDQQTARAIVTGSGWSGSNRWSSEMFHVGFAGKTQYQGLSGGKRRETHPSAQCRHFWQPPGPNRRNQTKAPQCRIFARNPCISPGTPSHPHLGRECGKGRNLRRVYTPRLNSHGIRKRTLGYPWMILFLDEQG